MSKNGRSKNKQVLGGYKKVGPNFIPPAKQLTAPLQEVSYARQMLPELIWWDVISQATSHQFSVSVATTIAEHFKGESGNFGWLCFASDYTELSEPVFNGLNAHLEKTNLLKPLREALLPFIQLYPECPLRGLLGTEPIGPIAPDFLTHFEQRMEELEYKRSEAGILMQAQAVYMGFALEKLKVFKGSSLIELHELSNYPNTEKSKRVAAMVCAHVNSMGGGGQFLPPFAEDRWALYFWERNLTLKPINFDHIEE